MLGKSESQDGREEQMRQGELVGRYGMNFLAFCLLAYLITLLVNGLGSTQWKIVQGHITKSEIIMQAGAKGPNPTASLSYDYQIDGKDYQGRSLEAPFNGPLFGLSNVKEILSRYPEKSIARIHVDPQNLSSSCLEPGVNWLSFSITVVFLSLCSIPMLSRFFSSDGNKNASSKIIR